MVKNPNLKTVAIIVAAGRGTRASTGADELPKQYQFIGRQPILAKTLTVFASSSEVDQILTIIHSDDMQQWQIVLELLSKNLPAEQFEKILAPVSGGATRQQSVFKGLEHLSGDPPHSVIIHDAVRPFVKNETISSVIQSISDVSPAILAALPVVDTLKRVDDTLFVKETTARNNVWLAQTPQGFLYSKLYDAHKIAVDKGKTEFTDDAAICEWCEIPVLIVEGEKSNMKITSKEDLILADKQSLLEKYAESADIRVGTGFDVHAFGEGKNIVLGGVEIQHDRSLIGHSDSDIVLHTLTDAVLGAIAEGDIGEHFPPDNAKFKNADSRIFLEYACERVLQRGGLIAHLDATILCEMPKIGPHRDKIRSSIAQICKIPLSAVSVKATTTEKLGFTGRQEGIACMASATIRLPIK